MYSGAWCEYVITRFTRKDTHRPKHDDGGGRLGQGWQFANAHDDGGSGHFPQSQPDILQPAGKTTPMCVCVYTACVSVPFIVFDIHIT